MVGRGRRGWLCEGYCGRQVRRRGYEERGSAALINEWHRFVLIDIINI